MIGLRRATARCPLASARCSCVCMGFRHSVSMSSDTGATQQCSTMAGSINVVFWRCCFEFLVWLGGTLKDRKNVGELVSPPWCPSHGELKVHVALVCSTPYAKWALHSPVSLELLLAQGQQIQLLEEIRCFRQHLSHLPPPSPPCCWQPLHPQVDTLVSQPDLLIYRPKMNPGAGS